MILQQADVENHVCWRWKVSLQAHYVKEIDQIVRENLTGDYTEYFRRYH